MRAILIFVIIFISFYSLANESKLSSFETDFCTNYREGTSANPSLWKHCCLIHDMYFWAGGNKQDRYDADLELKSCIASTGARRTAQLMYLAVRAGSYSPVKYPKRKWNNGWGDRGNYQSLTQDDIEKIETELFDGYDYISNEIKIYFINALRSRLE